MQLQLMPYGYCQCGCGTETERSTRNHRRYDWVKGQPQRFIEGHQNVGRKFSHEHMDKLHASRRGKRNTAEHNLRIGQAQLGEKGPNWRGGKYTREGRLMVYIGRDNAMADVYGYSYAHRVVMSQGLGRTLTSSEHVHHIDCDHTNNAPDNLVVLTPAEHRRVHNYIRWGEMPCYEALQRGVERFK